MIELVMFDADGVLFDSTESNVAYYNWIFAQVGEPPLDPDEEIAARFVRRQRGVCRPRARRRSQAERDA